MENLHGFSHPLRDTANHAYWVNIKGCHNLIILLEEIFVDKERASHVSNANNCYTPFPVNPQDFFDMEFKLLDIVTHSTNTELSKVREILSYLGRIYIANLSK